jgi:uncharacterized protein
MSSISRFVQSAIEAVLIRGKAIMVYGARQTGKTTLLKSILESHPDKSLYLDCSDPGVQRILSERKKVELRALIGNHTLIAIDDAHLVRNIGLAIKQIGEDFHEAQVIAAGAVSLFDLSNDLKLPLTGGKTRFTLYPLMVGECSPPPNPQDAYPWLGDRLRYGMYPSVMASAEPETILAGILTCCLEPAALLAPTLQNLPRPRNLSMLRSLLEIVALRIGSEISFNELGSILGLDKITVGRYISLAEQAGILFHLPAFKRRMPKELGKLRKIYFYDLGLRNALLHNFSPLNLRMDVDSLWENFVISERLKLNRNRGKYAGGYFWRIYSGTRLDYIEEDGGRLTLYDCAWREKKRRIPASFARAYPGSQLYQVTPHNFQSYLNRLS